MITKIKLFFEDLEVVRKVAVTVSLFIGIAFTVGIWWNEQDWTWKAASQSYVQVQLDPIVQAIDKQYSLMQEVKVDNDNGLVDFYRKAVADYELQLYTLRERVREQNRPPTEEQWQIIRNVEGQLANARLKLQEAEKRVKDGISD